MGIDEKFSARVGEDGEVFPRAGFETLSDADKIQLLFAEGELKKLGRFIKQLVPSNWGFTLHMFQYGPGGGATYISTAERGDVVKMLRELAEKLEQGQL